MADSAIHIGQVVVIDQEVLSIAADIASHKTAENGEAPTQGEAGEQQGEVAEVEDQTEAEPTKDEENKAQSVSDTDAKKQHTQDAQSGATEEQEDMQDTPTVPGEKEDTVAEEPEKTGDAAESEEGEPAAGDSTAVEPEVDDVAVAKQKINELDQSIQQQEASRSLLSSSASSGTAINTEFTFSPITLAPESSKPSHKTTSTSSLAAAAFTQKPSSAPQVVKKVKSSASVSTPARIYLATGALLLSLGLFSQYF